MVEQRLREIVRLRAARLITLLALAGCGGGELSDEPSGFVDLVPFFRGGATVADPTAGLPRAIGPTRGWTSGNRVEYLDFGAVTVPRKLGTRGETLRIPDAARVFPMYFFFDSGGRPLFSKPAFDGRTGGWHMRGGRNPPDPAPLPPPSEGPGRNAYFATSFWARPRAVIVDTDRNSSEYQRPIIDTLLDDPNYTGLWEIVEITVKDSHYRPDDTKSAATIKDGIASGKLAQLRTGKVINCPVLDERTQVTPSVMANNIPRPRIEVWYRTKLGSCYLINGWETIGETLDESSPATDRANLRLFKAGVEQDRRLDTFDVNRVALGTGADQESTVTVPIAKLYTPTVTVPLGTPTMDRGRTRYAFDDLSVALPRHKEGDPPGYSPIVWLWDLGVPQDPPYQPGAYKDFGNVDPAVTVARDGDTTVLTRNYAIIGPAAKCVSNDDCQFGLQCNPMPDVTVATSDPPPGMNIADVVVAREGGPRCDLAPVEFGSYCAPGVSRCDVQTAAGGENEKRLKALGVGPAGPTFTIHADLKTAQTNLSDNISLAAGIDPKMPGRPVSMAEQAAAQAAIPGLQATADQLNQRVANYDALGFTTDLGGYGYMCHPQNGGGFCQIRCDSAGTNTAATVMTELPVVDSAGNVTPYKYTFNTESRCGGANMLGYRCLPATVQPDRQRVCMRECNTMNIVNPPNVNRALCDFPLNLKPDADGNATTAFSFSEGLPPVSMIARQSCSVTPLAFPLATATGITSSITACSWNPDLEPGDPAVWPGQ
jgi:hypothetical protein